MSKSALSRPQVANSVGRSSAELSTTLNFNQSAGMLLPLLARPFIAGTDGYISRSSFCRSKTPLFPAFQSVTQHVDVFLVPLRYLYTPWNDWKLNINDLSSSKIVDFSGTLDLSLMTSVPRMDFGQSLWVDIAAQTTNVNRKAALVNDANRLFDLLGYGSVSQFGVTSNVQNLFKLAAYQKVYFDYYRNTAYEQNNPFAYNLDWLWKSNNGLVDRGNTIVPGTVDSFALNSLTALRYVNYRNDYFHNIYPSLNYVVSQPVGTNWQLPSGISQLISSPAVGSGGAVVPTGLANVNNTAGNPVQVSLSMSVQNIRAAFALDKLMRASAYAPKHVKEQFKARFDVDVPESVGMECVRIGSWQNDIVFGEVTSTANTSDPSNNTGDSLGAVGGKGVGSGKDSRIHFHCKEDSILLAVQYFVPLAMYDSRGIDEWNMKLVREDFFQPEFQNLGLRPLYRKALDFVDNSVSDNLLIGYTVPNQSYKVPINRNTGLFNSRFGVAYTTGAGSAPNVVIDVQAQSPLRSFTVHTNDVLVNSSVNGVNYNYFKVSPSDLNYLFEEPYDTYINDPRTDQFFGQTRFGIQITHNMSVHGQPSL